MRRTHRSLVVVGLVLALPGLAGCGSSHADCAYTGEPGSAQYERDIERAAANGCDEDEIVPYEG